MKNSRKIPKIIYIYLYFYGRALASSGRDLDAPKRAWEVATPKKRMLGLTPMVFLEVWWVLCHAFKVVCEPDYVTFQMVKMFAGHLSIAGLLRCELLSALLGCYD